MNIRCMNLMDLDRPLSHEDGFGAELSVSDEQAAQSGTCKWTGAVRHLDGTIQEELVDVGLSFPPTDFGSFLVGRFGGLKDKAVGTFCGLKCFVLIGK